MNEITVRELRNDGGDVLDRVARGEALTVTRDGQRSQSCARCDAVQVVADFRHPATRGSARVRAYADVHPSAESRLTLDASVRNRWGDPMPKIEQRLDADTEARGARTRAHIVSVFERLAAANNAIIASVTDGRYLNHPAGGCRAGTDATTSVCDSYGRTHDHENLFVVGAPTLPTAGCTNGTLTFVALTLRSAQHIADTLSRGASGLQE